MNIVAAFWGMHVSPVKHSSAWLPRKCDYRTDTRTDRRRTKWSLCAAMLRRRHKNTKSNTVDVKIFQYIVTNYEVITKIPFERRGLWLKVVIFTFNFSNLFSLIKIPFQYQWPPVWSGPFFLVQIYSSGFLTVLDGALLCLPSSRKSAGEHWHQCPHTSRLPS